MKALDRYLFGQFVATFFFMMAMLIVVSLVIDFAEKYDNFVSNDAPWGDVFGWYYVNFVPWIANLLSPICVFLAAIYFTARLAQNTEFVAMFAGGISFYRLLLPYLAASLLFGGLSFWLNAYEVPRAMESRIDFEYEYLEQKKEFKQRHIQKKLSENSYIYLYRFNQFKNMAYRVVLERYEQDTLREKIWANVAQYNDSTDTWQLRGVEIRRFGPREEFLVKRAKLDTSIFLVPGDIYQRDHFVQGLTLSELSRFIEKERIRGSDLINTLLLEYYSRSAYPFASVILTVIGYALSTQKRRGGIAMQLGTGFILCFVYVTILVAAKGALAGSFPAWLAVWSPNILFSVVGVTLLWLAPK